MASTNSHRVHAPTPAPIRKVRSTSTWDGRDGSKTPATWRCECWMLVGGSFLYPKTTENDETREFQQPPPFPTLMDLHHQPLNHDVDRLMGP